MMSRLSVVLLIALCLANVAAAEVVRWVPAAAAVDGRFGTQWTTDLWIFSRVVDAPITVSIAFLTTAEGTMTPTEVALEIPPSTAVEIQDVITTLFGYRASGALRLRSEYDFDARTRTSNDGGDAGTFGQGIPAVADDAAFVEGRLLGAANIPGDAGTRSNLGLLNLSEDETEVWVFVFAGPGSTELIGQARVELGSFGWSQDDVFDLVGAATRTTPNATITYVSLGETPVIGYLSRVDNISGDGTYLMPFTARIIRTIPRAWQVEIEVGYSADVHDVQVVYTGMDGQDVTVTDAETGWTSGTLDFTSGDTFCYVANATADTSGWLDIQITRRVDNGGAWEDHSSQAYISGGPALTLEECWTLD
jgi:hypothetical protein